MKKNRGKCAALREATVSLCTIMKRIIKQNAIKTTRNQESYANWFYCDARQHSG
jgi:hypothetical protein